MGRIAIKILLILLITQTVKAQWDPDFYIYERDKKTGNKVDHFSYLEKDVYKVQYLDTIPTWGVFFFKVSNKGTIDSTFYHGTLKDALVHRITTNIYSTRGHWKIKKGAKNLKSYWLIYPFFHLGEKYCQDVKCSPTEKALQINLERMSETIIEISKLSNNKNSYILRAYRFGAGYDIE